MCEMQPAQSIGLWTARDAILNRHYVLFSNIFWIFDFEWAKRPWRTDLRHSRTAKVTCLNIRCWERENNPWRTHAMLVPVGTFLHIWFWERVDTDARPAAVAPYNNNNKTYKAIHIYEIAILIPFLRLASPHYWVFSFALSALVVHKVDR